MIQPNRLVRDKLQRMAESGSDAYDLPERALQARTADIDRYRSLGRGTAFEDAGLPAQSI
jgi:hypothetical protein